MEIIEFGSLLDLLNEVGELREEVKSLELRMSEYEKSKASNLQDSSKEDITSDQQKLKDLDNKVKSNNPHDWFKVAESDFATERHLLRVAEKCANLNYYNNDSGNSKISFQIAKAISENQSTTDEVMKKLAKSHFSDVLLLVAMSNKSGKNALSEVAEKIICCSLINYKTPNNITVALFNNPSTPQKIKQALHYI